MAVARRLARKGGVGRRTVRLRLKPDGADVVIDGQRHGARPLTVVRGAPVLDMTTVDLVRPNGPRVDFTHVRRGRGASVRRKGTGRMA